MTKTILEEAMEDAKQLKKTAIENAKNVLVEALSPKIRKLVENQIGETDLTLEMPMMDTEEDEELPVEGMYEVADADEDEEEGGDNLEEAKDEDEEEEESMDEVVEITEADVRRAVSEFLKEADVSKGFGDVADANTDTGIADEKTGEHAWNDEDPPAAQDWTVKEGFYRKRLKNLQGENRKLKTDVAELAEACNYLRSNLQEVNLFNSRLLYTNKILQNASLSNKQKVSIIESFDKAKSLREVQLVYESLSKSLTIAGVLGENKTVSGVKTSRSSRLMNTSGVSRILEEQQRHEAPVDSFSMRMKKLAGLVE